MSSQSILQSGVKKRELIAWAFYDFANSGYTTVVLTTVFTAYFVGVLAADYTSATLLLTLILSASYLLLMVTLPQLGRWVDQKGTKKQLLFFSTVLCVLCTACLYFATPGYLLLGILFLFVSNYAYGIGEAMIAAYLPSLAKPAALGRVSGWGWGFGYFGGMLTLGLALAVVTYAEKNAVVAAQYVPWVMVLTAVIFAVAAVPAMLFLRPNTARAPITPPVAKQSLVALFKSCQRDYPNFARLLVCGACYHAGIAVIVTLSSVYATQAMNFTMSQTMMLIFVVNIAAAIGALSFGHIQDRLGHKKSLALTLVGWLCMVIIAASTQSAEGFWVAATIAGLCIGSSQSAGRAMVGLLTPAERGAEMYALWGAALQLAAIVGPLGYGLINWLSGGSHRLALACTALFFIAALWLLRRIQFVNLRH